MRRASVCNTVPQSDRLGFRRLQRGKWRKRQQVSPFEVSCFSLVVLERPRAETNSSSFNTRLAFSPFSFSVKAQQPLCCNHAVGHAVIKRHASTRQGILQSNWQKPCTAFAAASKPCCRATVHKGAGPATSRRPAGAC